MLSRKITIQDVENESIFLWGARQTGKSTWLKMTFPDKRTIDLLKSDDFERYNRRPALLREELSLLSENELVIIDEIQKVPALLDEVHWLISNHNLRFILSGSSARKLRRGGVNLLGGRAVRKQLYPFVSSETPNFDLIKACNNGMLPRHYLVENAANRLRAYVGDYLQQEIKAEALTRNVKRRVIQSPKFYYFDVGIANFLLKRTEINPGSPEFGHAFEHFILQEIIAYIGYFRPQQNLSYWRTSSGYEVDAIIGNAETAIEIKSSDEVQSHHTKGLKAFSEEFPDARLIIVSLDKNPRKMNNVEIYPAVQFLSMLWNGSFF